MKSIYQFTSAGFALMAGGCVGAESTSLEQPVPVAVAPAAPLAPAAPVAQSAPLPPSSATLTTTAATVAMPVAAVNPLDQLVAPIALYPDVLVALILPASTVSSDVVLAARYLAAGGDPQQIDAQSWDDSVKGLARYPEVVKWMDENLAWTQQLGAAYLESAENVMNALQRVRTQAKAKGLLANTPQQQVVTEGEAIAIVPAQPDVIYVPRYDPEIIFVDRPVIYVTDPWLTFGASFGVGWWLCYDFDWHQRRIWIDRHSRDHWRDRPIWRQPHFVGGGGPARPPGWETWRPSPNRPRPVHRDYDHDRRPTPRPTPMPGAPHRGDEHRDSSPGRTPGEVQRYHPERPGAPGVAPTPRLDRGAPAARPVTTSPIPPRVDRSPGSNRPERRNDGASPDYRHVRPEAAQPRPVTTPAPAQDRQLAAPRDNMTQGRAVPAPSQPVRIKDNSDQRQLAPAMPRADRAPRPEPVQRVAPPAPAVPRSSPSPDTSSRSRSEPDGRREQER